MKARNVNEKQKTRESVKFNGKCNSKEKIRHP